MEKLATNDIRFGKMPSIIANQPFGVPGNNYRLGHELSVARGKLGTMKYGRRVPEQVWRR